MSYTAAPVPYDLDEIPRYLAEELTAIQRETERPSAERIRLDVLYVEPERPRNGDIAYADGTEWNPGSGEGFYGYEAGAWVKF